MVDLMLVILNLQVVYQQSNYLPAACIKMMSQMF
jgi:hypothetical protein